MALQFVVSHDLKILNLFFIFQSSSWVWAHEVGFPREEQRNRGLEPDLCLTVGAVGVANSTPLVWPKFDQQNTPESLFFLGLLHQWLKNSISTCCILNMTITIVSIIGPSCFFEFSFVPHLLRRCSGENCKLLIHAVHYASTHSHQELPRILAVNRSILHLLQWNIEPKIWKSSKYPVIQK